MTDQTIAEKTISLLRDILDCEEEILPEASLVDDYGINSMESMILLSQIERTWNIRMSGKLLYRIDTVRDLIDTIGSLLCEKNAESANDPSKTE